MMARENLSENLSENLLTVQSLIKKHSRFQLEATFNYAIPHVDTAWLSKPKYQTDLYLFFPAHIKVDPSNYPIKQFFSDTKALIRLREPKYRYHDLLPSDKLSATSRKTPLQKIRLFLAGKKTDEMIEKEFRFFACNFASYLARRINKVLKKLEDDSLGPKELQVFERCAEVFENGRRLLKSYLDFEAGIREKYPDTTIQEEYLESLEYCVYVFRDFSLKVLQRIDFDVSSRETDFFVRLRRDLLEGLALCQELTKKHDFFWIDDRSSEPDLEKFVARRSYLKKHVWSVLYLDPRPNFVSMLRKHVFAMLAAALAATWAFVTTVVIWSYSSFSGFQFLDHLSISGVLLVCFAFVTAYIGKDRIKEITRNILNQKDSTTNNIFYTDFKGEKVSIGKIAEHAEYIRFKKLDPTIKQKFMDLCDTEHSNFRVIHYHKEIVFGSKRFLKHTQRSPAVHDILRLNVENYLRYLSDSEQQGLVLNQNNKVETISLPRVYRILGILKYKSNRGSKPQKKGDGLQLFEIVLNRDGIVRIENA